MNHQDTDLDLESQLMRSAWLKHLAYELVGDEGYGRVRGYGAATIATIFATPCPRRASFPQNPEKEHSWHEIRAETTPAPGTT